MLPLLTGAAIGAAGFLGYHSLAPRSQFFGETFIGTPGRGRKLALTYDDGPNDPDTPSLLDVLDSHQVKATFFLIGKYAAQRPDLVRSIADRGHEIGNHTYSHPNLAFVSEAREVDELLRCQAELLKSGFRSAVTKREGDANMSAQLASADTLEKKVVLAKNLRESCGTTLFRAPFGGRRSATLRVARELGYIPIQWTVTCFDWKRTTSLRVERHAIRQIRGGDIVLMHDGGHKHFGADRRHSVEATDRLIARYKQEDFEFVTVSEMMTAAKIP